MSAAAYLRRLGLPADLPPTLETLVAVHRAHLAQVPYENLDIVLGHPPGVDPAACLERVVERGRAGYCFHHNGALETVLVALGFDVTRRHGHVWTDEAGRRDLTLNHLVLVVSGLPTPANPGGRWWPDVGVGDGFLDPLPLVAGEHRQTGFASRLEDVDERGWTFRHDPSGSFAGMEVRDLPTDGDAVAAAHHRLSTPPDGQFTRILVVQRRDATGADLLRGCLLLRVTPAGTRETELTSYDEWRAALRDQLRVPLEHVDDSGLRDLWQRTRVTHEAWTAAGRP